MPVLWIPIKGEIPEILRKLQLNDDDLPVEYKREGLSYLLQLRHKQSQYKEFVVRFAQKVIDAANGPAVPPLYSLPPLDEIQSAFRAQPLSSSPPDTAEGAGGPNNVKFVFVAARRKEMQGIRDNVTYYHDEGGWHWRPYSPIDEKTVGRIAQEVTTSASLRYHEIPLDQNTIQRIQQADEKNEITLIIVDTWTMMIPPYQQIMRLYDESKGSLNCAVLIPWNEEDAETTCSRSSLEDILKVTFKFRWVMKHPVYFRDSIRSAKQLREGIRDTLVRIKMNILAVSTAEKEIAYKPRPLPTISASSGTMQ